MRSNSEFETSRVANIKSNKCKLVKSLKPLVNFKFYLDIEKHHISLKIETKIRELGGSIEFFLTDNVTHFITDKIIDKEGGGSNQSPQTPVTPQTPLNSNYSDVYLGSSTYSAAANNDLKAASKIKSRADAMLHRARKDKIESVDKKVLSQRSPTQVAKNRGTPIWHTDYALKFFDKVCSFIRDRYVSKHRVGNSKALKGNYIKIESFEKHCRPYYQLFKSNWPKVNLHPTQNSGAFQHDDSSTSKIKSRAAAPCCPPTNGIKSRNEDNSTNTITTNMTRKNRSKQIRVKQNPKISSDKQCGFCEICRVEYDVLTVHLKTDEHVNFVKNDNNFLALDSLIKSSANVDKFLTMNNKKVFGTAADCELYPKRSKRNAAINNSMTSSINDKQHHTGIIDTLDSMSVIDSNISDKKSDLKNVESCGRQTRQSQIKQTLTSSQQSQQNRQPVRTPEKKVEVTGVMVRARRESLKKINYAEPKEDEENSNDVVLPVLIDYHKKKRAGNTKTRESPSKKGPGSSPEKKEPKLPSNVLYKVVTPGTDKSKDSNNRNDKTSESGNNAQPNPIIMKIRKLRMTQLAVLNVEAANFMFPNKKASELSTDTERKTSSEQRNTVNNIPSSELNTTIDKPPLKRKSSSSQVNNKSGSSSTIDEQQPRSSVRDDTGTEFENISSSSGNKRRKSSLPPPPPSSSKNDCVGGDSSKRNLSASSERFRVAPIQPRGRKSWKKKRLSTNNNIPIENPPEDRMGEEVISNLENILNSEHISQYKFAFERVPWNEPWYNVFRRQDECREKYFEYYGNTTYRKLPFEMGPMPALVPECCPLNSTKPPPPLPVLKKTATSTTTTTTTTTIISKSIIKETAKEPETQPIVVTTTVTKTEQATNNKTIKRPKLKEIKSENPPNIPESISLDKDHKPLSRISTIIDLERPRKSPREHASTLAMLSCLIKQRTEKSSIPSSSSSPIPSSSTTAEPQSSESASVIKLKTEIEPIRKISEPTPPDTTSSSLASSDNSNKIKIENDTVVNEEEPPPQPQPPPPPPPTKTTQSSDEPQSAATASQTTKGKKLDKNPDICQQIGESVKRLRRGEKLMKRRIAMDDDDKRAAITSFLKKRPYKKSLKKTNDKIQSINNQKDNYVNVNKLTREIDYYLLNSLQCFDEESLIDDAEEPSSFLISPPQSEVNFLNDIELYDLFVDQSNENASQIRSSNTLANNRLRLYKVFSNNKKRKNNKTGWPKKRRVVTRQHSNIKVPNLNGLSSIEISCKPGEDIKISAQSPMTPPETDPDEKPADLLVDYDIPLNGNRDDTNNFRTLSASDKADNSDIFTVSSDSLDTVLDINNQTKNVIDEKPILPLSLIGNNDSNSSSAGFIQNMLIDNNRRSHQQQQQQQQQIKLERTIAIENNSDSNCCLNVLTTTTTATNTTTTTSSVRNIIKSNFNRRQTSKRRTNGFVGRPRKHFVPKSSPLAARVVLNNSSPSEIVLNKRTSHNSILSSSSASLTAFNEQTTNNIINSKKLESTSTTTATSSSTSSTVVVSPRKLRKPRGRWYRER